MTTREFKVVQTCWFTGVRLVIQDRTKNGPDRGKPEAPNRWTQEHIVPLVSHLIGLIPPELQRKNTAPAAGYVNNMVGSLPLGSKIAIRDRLRRAIHGTTDLRGVEPIEWSSEIKSLAAEIIREEDYRFRIGGKKVYHNPVVVPAEGIRMWSIENPHHGFTAEVLAERDRLLTELHAITRAAFVERFGIDTPEVTAAIEADLSKHTVPTGRDMRKASQNLAES